MKVSKCNWFVITALQTHLKVKVEIKICICYFLNLYFRGIIRLTISTLQSIKGNVPVKDKMGYQTIKIDPWLAKSSLIELFI